MIVLFPFSRFCVGLFIKLLSKIYTAWLFLTNKYLNLSERVNSFGVGQASKLKNLFFQLWIIDWLRFNPLNTLLFLKILKIFNKF